jgi:hypothetical protein
MGVSSFLGLGFMFISYNPDTPALQLLHNNSYTTHLAPRGKVVLTCPNANNILYFLENCLMGREQDNTDHTCLFTPTTMTVLLRKCGYRPISFHFVAENLAYYKGTAIHKALAHVMWAIQATAGVFRPCLCKNFITVAEPMDESAESVS